MTDPEEKLLAAIREEESDLADALAEANDILYPDPAKALAVAISERKTAVREWKDCLKQCDALTADLEAIRFMVGRPELSLVEAVRRRGDDARESQNTLRSALEAANRCIGQIAVALGLSEHAPAVAVIGRAKAAHENRAAADLRAALDRVAMEAGVDTEGDGFDVADRVIAVLRAMQARPMLTVERLADALRAASVTLEPTMAARAVMAAMSHMGDLVLSESPPTSRPAALPADLRTYLETRRDRLQGGHGLGLAAEIAALNRWLALPTAEVTP